MRDWEQAGYLTADRQTEGAPRTLPIDRRPTYITLCTPLCHRFRAARAGNLISYHDERDPGDAVVILSDT
jgi:hypothetical protein